MATWAEQHEAIQTALEKLKSKKAEVKPIGPDLKNYKKPAGPAVDRCAKDKQWLACQEGRHQYNGKNFCGRCGEPRPKQVPVGDRRSRLHAALDAVMTYSKPPVIRKTLSILNPNDLAKMTGSSEPQYIGKGKPYTGFAKDSQHWMPETGNHALADKLHAQLTGEGFSPAFGSGNKAGDITYRYEKGKERAYLLARRNGQHTIERKAAGAYGKGLAKDAQWTPEGAARQLEAKIVHYLEGERSGRANYDIDKVCAPLDRQLRALGWKYNYTSQELEPLKSKAKDGWQPTSGGSRYVGGTLTLGFVRAKGNEFEAETWAGNKKACSTEQEARKWLLSQKEVSGKGLAKDAKPWPTGAKVVVLAGKHTGERGTVEHSDSKITTVKFSDCKSDPVWTDSLSIYGG
jgi:hypothetical protein